MKAYSLRRAVRTRLASLADWLTIHVRSSDATAARYVFHPMGVIRIVTPDEDAELGRRSKG